MLFARLPARLSLGLAALLVAGAAIAQTPPASDASKDTTKDATKEATKEGTPATPAPAAPATPPAAAGSAAGSTSPAAPSAQAADPFGEEVTLAAKTVIYVKGTANWDTAFDTIQESMRTLNAFMDKQNVKPAGPAMVVYTSTDDTGFTYQAEVPVAEVPKGLTRDINSGKSPEGKALKFVHRGSYDNMDNTYEAITNHLDEKKLEAKDTFIEEYVTDAIKTPEDNLVINIFVPLK